MTGSVSQVYGQDIIPYIRTAILDGNYEAARTMAGVVECNAIIDRSNVPGCFGQLKTAIDILSIPYHMKRALKELGKGNHSKTLSELVEVSEHSKKLGLPLPEGYTCLRKMALDDMATELLTDAFMWLGEWKETGRCHIDPYNIGRLIETSELCYKKAEAPIPKELGMMKRELGRMKRA